MFGFGHFASTYFLIKLFGKGEEKRLILILSLIGFLPDIDLLLPLPHRTITHHIYFFFPELIVYNIILFIFSRKVRILTPILIHLMHIFSDSLFGYVGILPGLKISLLDLISPQWDAIYGSIFVILSFLVDHLKFKKEKRP